MITGISSFSIIASSEASIAFYEKLGFLVSHRMKRGYDTVVLLKGYGVLLQLFIDPKHPVRASDPENLGLRSVSFEIQSVDEIRTLFNCSEIKTDWFGRRYCTTYDPDGLPIQFVERKRI